MVPMSCSAGIHCILRICKDKNQALLSPDVDEFSHEFFPMCLETHLQFTERLHNYTPFMKPMEGCLVIFPLLKVRYSFNR